MREPRPEVLQSTIFNVDAETGMLPYWILLPEGNRYQSFELLRYLIGDASAPELVVPANLLNSADGQILAFALLSLKPGFAYECRWAYRE